MTYPLELPATSRAQIETWAVRDHPREACGLLVGRRGRDCVTVTEVTRSRNLETDRAGDRFELAPADWLETFEAAQRDGLEIVGVWHSHPDHPAEPSREDVAAAWDEYACLIVSATASGAVDLRSWWPSLRGLREQPIREQP